MYLDIHTNCATMCVYIYIYIYTLCIICYTSFTYKNHHSFYSGDVPYIAQQGARHQGETVLGTYRGAPDLHGAKSGASGQHGDGSKPTVDGRNPAPVSSCW